MPNITIAIDIDDTISEFVENWLRIYNKDFNDNLKKEDILDWNISQFVKPEAKGTIYNYINKPRVFRTAKPIKNALPIINKFREKAKRIIYVTANDGAGAKLPWLFKYGFIHTSEDFVVAYDKSLIRADILIDDRPENVMSFKGWGILLTQPWNQNIDYEGRVFDWQDLEDKICL
jgi:5'-nucleotidase